MQALRHASHLARLVLASFVLAIGLAAASPLLKRVDLELVCSAAGSFKLVDRSDGGEAPATHGIDCPLCVPLDAPPPPVAVGAPVPPPLAHALRSIPAARMAALAAAPLPARGPPASFPA